MSIDSGISVTVFAAQNQRSLEADSNDNRGSGVL